MASKIPKVVEVGVEVVGRVGRVGRMGRKVGVHLPIMVDIPQPTSLSSHVRHSARYNCRKDDSDEDALDAYLERLCNEFSDDRSRSDSNVSSYGQEPEEDTEEETNPEDEDIQFQSDVYYDELNAVTGNRPGTSFKPTKADTLYEES